MPNSCCKEPQRLTFYLVSAEADTLIERRLPAMSAADRPSLHGRAASRLRPPNTLSHAADLSSGRQDGYLTLRLRLRTGYTRSHG